VKGRIDSTSENGVPLFSRLYLPYCVAAPRAEVRKELVVDLVVWTLVLLLSLIHFLLRIL